MHHTISTRLIFAIACALATTIPRADIELNLLAATGGQGSGPNRYGDAHVLTLDAQDNIHVADMLNWCVQKLVKCI